VEWDKAKLDWTDINRSATEFIERFVDKRHTRAPGGSLVLKKRPKLVRLPDYVWDKIDRNRAPMGMSISQFVQYCVVKTTKPFDQARAIQRGQDE